MAHKPVVFIHLPKTAGTALRAALCESLGVRSEDAVIVDPSTMGGFNRWEDIDPRVRQFVRLQPTELDLATPLISAHIAPSLTLPVVPAKRHLSILREPRARTLSAWLYYRMQTDRVLRYWGSYGDYIRAARQPLVGWLNDPRSTSHSDNAMVRQLLWPHALIPDDDFISPEHDDQLFREALDLLRSFGFIGVIEDRAVAENLADWLEKPLDIKETIDPHRMPRHLRPDVRAELAAAADVLLERNRIDDRLWRALAAEALPGTDLDALADRTFERAAQRHAEAMANGPKPPLAHRVLDASWDVAGPFRRLDHARVSAALKPLSDRVKIRTHR